MIKRIINADGLFIRDDFTCEEHEIALDVEASQGLYLPRWDFELEKWVEAGTPPLPTPQEPTLQDRVEALEMMEIERLLHG